MSLEGEIVGLSLAYVLLGLLLLAAVTRARLPWPVKAAAVVVTSAFYVVAYFRIEGLLGWAAHERLPPQFQLLWARSVEPNLAAGSRGAVYLWIEELDEANLPSGVPRAYRLPWSAALARKIETARDEIMNRRPQGGRAEAFGTTSDQPAPEGAVATAAEPGGDPMSGGPLDPAFLGGESQTITFAPLPVAKLPPKDVPP
jgi:hypothetical protein